MKFFKGLVPKEEMVDLTPETWHDINGLAYCLSTYAGSKQCLILRGDQEQLQRGICALADAYHPKSESRREMIRTRASQMIEEALEEGRSQIQIMFMANDRILGAERMDGHYFHKEGEGPYQGSLTHLQTVLFDHCSGMVFDKAVPEALELLAQQD